MSGYILEGERGRWMMYRERMSGYVSERNKGGVREGVQAASTNACDLY